MTTRVRIGLTLLETTVAVLIMGIAAAVVTPRWSDFQRQVTLNSASAAFSSDVRALQRYAARKSTSISLSIPAGGSTMTINPPLPSLLGDAMGTVDYALRYPGVTFQGVPFGGTGTATINMRGELVSSTTGDPVDDGSVSLGSGGILTNLDLTSALNLSGLP